MNRKQEYIYNNTSVWFMQELETTGTDARSACCVLVLMLLKSKGFDEIETKKALRELIAICPKLPEA